MLPEMLLELGVPFEYNLAPQSSVVGTAVFSQAYGSMSFSAPRRRKLVLIQILVPVPAHCENSVADCHYRYERGPKGLRFAADVGFS